MTLRNSVVLVDEQDNSLGVEDKMLAHEKGLLHRAFSVMLYRYTNNKIEFLLQQRAKSKYHCGGQWANTCCSHPQLDENILDSAGKRLKEELGDIKLNNINLQEIATFIYRAEFENGLIEHELDHVLISEYNSEPEHINIEEVESVKWLSSVEIKTELDKNAQQFTPWFKQVFEICLKHLE